jgi:hypothetical protein
MKIIYGPVLAFIFFAILIPSIAAGKGCIDRRTGFQYGSDDRPQTENCAVDGKHAHDDETPPKAKASRGLDRNSELKNGVRIGMTKDQVVRSAWGRPASINKTTTHNIVREQWIYGGNLYLYFQNGRLSAIQN